MNAHLRSDDSDEDDPGVREHRSEHQAREPAAGAEIARSARASRNAGTSRPLSESATCTSTPAAGSCTDVGDVGSSRSSRARPAAAQPELEIMSNEARSSAAMSGTVSRETVVDRDR